MSARNCLKDKSEIPFGTEGHEGNEDVEDLIMDPALRIGQAEPPGELNWPRRTADRKPRTKLDTADEPMAQLSGAQCRSATRFSIAPGHMGNKALPEQNGD